MLLGARPAGGEDAGPPADPATAAAASYLASIASEGEAQALEQAHAQGADPWTLAEELLLIGREDVALRLAQAQLSSDADALTAYLQRAPRPDANLARRVAQCLERLKAGQAAEALAALDSATGGSLTITEVRALSARADALAALDRAAEARDALERVATRATVIGWRRAASAAQRRLLQRTDPQLQPTAVRRILASLLALDGDTRDLGRSATWCSQLGRMEHERGATRAARRWLLEAEGLFDVLARGAGLSPTLARERFFALRILSHVQMELGSTAAGVAAAFRADDAARHMDTPLRVEAATQLAEVYSMLGRLDEAEVHARQALELAAGYPQRQRARLQGDLARLLVERGHFEEALALYAEVRTALAGDPDPRARLVARLHVAAAWLDAPAGRRDVEGLQRSLHDLLQLQRDLEDLPPTYAARAELVANAQLLSTRALDLLRRPGEALPVLRTLVEDPYVRDSPGLLRYAHRELSYALRATGHLAEAFDVSTRAIEALAEEVGSLSASYAISVLSPPLVRELIEEHLASALALGVPARLVEALERTRGIAFLGELRRRQREGARGGREAGRHPALVLAAQVARAAQAYWRVLPLGKRREVVRARDELWELRRRLRAAQDRDEFEAVRNTEAAAAVRNGPRFRLPRALEPDEAMLYYAATAEEWLAVLVRADRAQAFVLGPREPLAERVARLHEAWVDGDEAPLAGVLHALAAEVVPPALRDALGVRRAGGERPAGPLPAHVYVSAGGALAHVPWPTVVRAALGGVDTGPTVSLVASQEVLRRLRLWNRAAGGGPLLALGDPDYSAASGRASVAIFGRKLKRLRETGDEAAALVDEDRSDLLLRRAEASEAMLRRCLFEAPYPFEVLHLACHGILYGKAAWMSALALHPTPGDDGLLTVDEVSDWRMPQGPRLVVLAACESGLGVPVAGEGEEGLVRAFLLAGARHVVASLWKVPDTTSRELMVAFHRHRREGGLAPAAALQRAQADVRAAHASVKPLSPHQWAGWAVWGPRD